MLKDFLPNEQRWEGGALAKALQLIDSRTALIEDIFIHLLIRVGKAVRIITALILLILSLIIVRSQWQINSTLRATATRHSYYVSKNGNSADGASWTTAWKDLNKIDWSVIQPGATILLDGGATSMTYTTTLTVGKSGVSGAPITIQLATEPGHNGNAIIFGGRSTPLKYCGQSNYTWQTNSVLTQGINLQGKSWIIIDGMKWRGIDIHGFNGNGIILSSSSSNDTIKNIEIYDNGIVRGSGTDEPGVRLLGSYLAFERMIIHDNGQDAFQSSGVNHLVLRSSWLYNGRMNPSKPTGTAFNEPCTHEDGIQIYDGGVQSDFLLENAIFGPGLMNGVILAELGPEHYAEIRNLTMKNTLWINASSNNIMGSPPSTQSWTIQNSTLFLTPQNASGDDHSSIYLDGSNFSIENSIVYGGSIHLPSSTAGFGNCQYKTYNNTGAVKGQTIDSKFVTNVGSYSNTVSFDQLINTDFALQPSSPCVGKGSSLTSVSQLLNTGP